MIASRGYKKTTYPLLWPRIWDSPQLAVDLGPPRPSTKPRQATEFRSIQKALSERVLEIQRSFDLSALVSGVSSVYCSAPGTSVGAGPQKRGDVWRRPVCMYRDAFFLTSKNKKSNFCRTNLMGDDAIFGVSDVMRSVTIIGASLEMCCTQQSLAIDIGAMRRTRIEALRYPKKNIYSKNTHST